MAEGIDDKALIVQMRTASGSLSKFTDACNRAAFSMLDLHHDLAPVDEQPVVSWEVERERFLRSLPDYD